MSINTKSDRRTNWSTLRLTTGLVVMLLFFLIAGTISYVNTQTLINNAQLVTHTHEVLMNLGAILSSAKDAETGQRGYLLTGDERYLEPYTIAVPKIKEQLDELQTKVADHPEVSTLLPTLRSRIDVKLRELEETITLHRSKGSDAANAIVGTDRGKLAMDSIREQIERMQEGERVIRKRRLDEMTDAYRVAIGSGIMTGVLGMALSLIVTFLLRRATKNRLRQEWLQAGEIQLGQVMSGDQNMKSLGNNVLKFMSEYLGAEVGAMFVNSDGFGRVATYGVPAESTVPTKFENDDGLLWRAVKDRRTITLDNIPENYLTVGSALGKSKPRYLLIAPLIEDGEANGVIELGFLTALDPSIVQFFDRVSESISVAIRSVNYRENLQNLLEETQRQSEELQTQGEELRVSNEELEEQSNALRQSQVRLENQQAELEETNSQLEEQAQILETQKDEVSRAKESLEMQSKKLEQASKHKSNFLANMSHELRTPLNSSLILSKLLADNPIGNLSEEQVQYAQTIYGAGNDLLNLINDILDLSKIEAGHMNVRPETVHIDRLSEDLKRIFQPLTEQKKLALQVKVSPRCPESLFTDRQRLEQILKNLLSNAVKFTEHGEVKLEINAAPRNCVSFSVSDTGIGIPIEKQQMIFRPFQQVEENSNRKYGGTGLGLSISKELTRLLGGELALKSEPAKGSTFTITLPEEYDANLAQEPQADSPFTPVAESEHRSRADRSTEFAVSIEPMPSIGRNFGVGKRIKDDREGLTSTSRVILIVEDDETFAKILYDLAHQLNFQCLIATTAEEGVAIAVQYLPSAVILDVGLPDNSGLTVLDRLKHDRRTRHIPVHVASASDYAETARALGAAGYLMKPVKREKLEETIQQVETQLAQRMRRVLIVEDDPVQLKSLQKLLESRDVETVGVGSAAECLEQLKGSAFDCMVMDLTLPDASGFSLLETLSREDAYTFPPVIVYTGRDLREDEEYRLSKYSKSIIIKGAKSPERLLDEVTLFLHQVITDLPAEKQRMLEKARRRDAAIEGRRILVVEDDVRNVFALTSILEPRGAIVQIARNGVEALEILAQSQKDASLHIDLVLMDVMMPVMDGIAATREIRERPELKKLPIIMLTAKAMKDDQETCMMAGANDYMAKPLDVEKLLSLVRVWMPR